jgi:hypothetical protein
MTTATETQTVAPISETPVAAPSLLALAKERAKAAASDPAVRKDAVKVGIGAAIGAALWAAFSS